MIAAVAFLLTAWIMTTISVDGLGPAMSAVILITLFNAVVRSLSIAVLAALSVISTGILALAFQVMTLLFVAQLVPGVRVVGFVPALSGSFVYAIINSALGDDGSVAPAPATRIPVAST